MPTFKRWHGVRLLFAEPFLTNLVITLLTTGVLALSGLGNMKELWRERSLFRVLLILFSRHSVARCSRPEQNSFPTGFNPLLSTDEEQRE